MTPAPQDPVTRPRGVPSRPAGTGHPGPGSEVRVRAPGKINLSLRVAQRRPDGFHPLTTVFQAVSVFEEVVATPSGERTLTVSGPQAELVPTDATNLALRAVELVAAYAGVDDGVHLHLHKGVPVAGGMAGGSADAAAALVACDALWHLGLGRDELLGLAAQLGSDVPFSLMGHTAVGTGRGDLLTPALSRGEFHWAFAVQDRGLSTARVFAAFDDLPHPPAPDHAADAPPVTPTMPLGVVRGGRRAAPSEEPDEAPPRLDVAPEPGRGDSGGRHTAGARRRRADDALGGADSADVALMQALLAGDAHALGAALHNDLQAAALHLDPALEEPLGVARRAGALGVVVSGSGPTVAALARSRQHALVLAAAFTAAGVADRVLTAAGPVAGARTVGSLDALA